MRLRIAVGVSQAWVEQAVPLLEEAGLRLVRSAFAAEGEFVECDFDYEGPGALAADLLLHVLARVRACIADSMVPHLQVTFVGG